MPPLIYLLSSIYFFWWVNITTAAVASPRWDPQKLSALVDQSCIKRLLHGGVGPRDRRLFTGPGGASDTFVHNSIISPQCPVEVALPF